jgi:hypothetical protein
MGLNTLDFGKMIFNMVEEKKPGLMDLVSRVIILMGKNMGKELISGLTDPVSPEVGLKTK